MPIGNIFVHVLFQAVLIILWSSSWKNWGKINQLFEQQKSDGHHSHFYFSKTVDLLSLFISSVAGYGLQSGQNHLTTRLTAGEESHTTGKSGGLLKEEQFCRKTGRSPGGQICNMLLQQIWPITSTSQPPGAQNILKGMFYYCYLPLSGLFYWYLFLTSKS